jgi:hypothetical protein
MLHIAVFDVFLREQMSLISVGCDCEAMVTGILGKPRSL